MVLSTAALLIFLLVCGASLASYVFSRWLAARTGRAIGWTGIALGTVFLLAAATITVLSTSVLSTLQWPGRAADDASASARIGNLSASSEAAHGGRTQESARQPTPSRSGAATQSKAGDRIVDTVDSEQSSAGESQPIKQLFLSDAAGDATRAPHSGRTAGVIVDPWAATRCVRSFRPDSEDLDRWSVENECLEPVAVLIATCSQSVEECNPRQAMSWKYQRGGMILPAKWQRPVSALEDTARGRQVRFVACLVTTPIAIRLIGSDSETRSSAAWLEQFAIARENDECLQRVRDLADAGAHSGATIDALLGARVSKGADPTQ